MNLASPLALSRRLAHRARRRCFLPSAAARKKVTTSTRASAGPCISTPHVTLQASPTSVNKGDYSA